MTEKQFAQICLKQCRSWGGGDAIILVYRESESDEREMFSTAVFGEVIDTLRRSIPGT